MADSHLGFDLPLNPRVERRRRGPDFLTNHRKALAAAVEGEVDLVVHGGDVFHRSRVHRSLVYQAFQPLVEVAESGIPVFVVPGNHERSRIPHHHLAVHPNLYVFHSPETRVIRVRDRRVSVSGFPYVRRGVREGFPNVLKETGWQAEDADIRLLCIHHCVEGATVGPSDFTFRGAPDVIRCADLPRDFAAVFSGHIHRAQMLHEDLQGRQMATPVLYPGSVERTAFAEMDEEKGFMIVEVEAGGSGGRLVGSEFHLLPSRPMVVRELVPPNGPKAFWTTSELKDRLQASIADVPQDAVFRLHVHGRLSEELRRVVAAAHLRLLAPPEMNLEVICMEDRDSQETSRSVRRRRASRRPPQPAAPLAGPAQFQMDLSSDQGG